MQMNQQKRKIFEGHLKEQEKAREAHNEKKKYLQGQKNNPQEDMLFIQKEFRNMNQQMDTLIAAHKKGQVPISTLVEQHTAMKNYYLQINYVLTTFDRQFYKELLEKINTTIFELRKKAEPKKKFKFKRRDEDFGVQETQIKQEIKAHERKETTIPGIEGRSSQKISITTECPNGGSFKIVNCSDCEVDILQKTEILFLKNLKNCNIRAAVTKSTVFVDNCHNCTFQLNCHQLRIHNTYQTKFYIYVTSKAIIEDCNKVIFSPYSFTYPNRETHEQEEDRNGKQNLWKDIQDFNWLKENEKSPHFELQE